MVEVEYTYRWFYGRDLKRLPDSVIRKAHFILVARPAPKAKYALLAIQNIKHEYERRELGKEAES